MTTLTKPYQQPYIEQQMTNLLVIYYIETLKFKSLLPKSPKFAVARAHIFTAVLLVICVFGIYQISNVAMAEIPRSTGAPQLSQTAAAAAALPKSKPNMGLAHSAPTRLEIPSISVDSSFAAVGQKEDGSIDVPPHDVVGWYTGAPTPGEIGPAVVVGHVDSSIYGPAVFFNLRDVKPDDTIRITREDGSIVNFKVEKSESYAQDAFPSASVYGNLDYPGLRLITCDGDFNYATHHYSNNLVVYAKMVQDKPN